MENATEASSEAVGANNNNAARLNNRNLILRKRKIRVGFKLPKTSQRNVSSKYSSMKEENRRLKIRVQSLDQRSQILHKQNLMLKRTIRILSETDAILNRQTEIMNRNTELLETIVQYMEHQRIRAG